MDKIIDFLRKKENGMFVFFGILGIITLLIMLCPDPESVFSFMANLLLIIIWIGMTILPIIGMFKIMDYIYKCYLHKEIQLGVLLMAGSVCSILWFAYISLLFVYMQI